MRLIFFCTEQRLTVHAHQKSEYLQLNSSACIGKIRNSRNKNCIENESFWLNFNFPGICKKSNISPTRYHYKGLMLSKTL